MHHSAVAADVAPHGPAAGETDRRFVGAHFEDLDRVPGDRLHRRAPLLDRRGPQVGVLADARGTDEQNVEVVVASGFATGERTEHDHAGRRHRQGLGGPPDVSEHRVAGCGQFEDGTRRDVGTHESELRRRRPWPGPSAARQSVPPRWPVRWPGRGTGRRCCVGGRRRPRPVLTACPRRRLWSWASPPSRRRCPMGYEDDHPRTEGPP